MKAFPQDRGFLGFVVSNRLKNNRFIAQSELSAVLVQKLEAGSEKNNVGNARYCASQGLERNNLWTAFNLTRLAQSSAHAYPCDAPGGRVLPQQDSCKTTVISQQKSKKWYAHMLFKTFVEKAVISTFLPCSARGNVSDVNPPSSLSAMIFAM